MTVPTTWLWRHTYKARCPSSSGAQTGAQRVSLILLAVLLPPRWARRTISPPLQGPAGASRRCGRVLWDFPPTCSRGWGACRPPRQLVPCPRRCRYRRIAHLRVSLLEKDVAVRSLAAPGEWVSAGYSGEGMVHAWLCAHALALMLLGLEEEQSVPTWFPDEYRLTQTRLKRATVERLMDRF
jgi:hypothetical protein